MDTELAFETFHLERTFQAPRNRVYRAWSDFDEKAKWFVGPEGRWTAVRREMDFRIDGQEILRGDFAGAGTSQFDARYLDIVPNERIVYAYRMYVDDQLFSITQVTVEFFDAGSGTRQKLTEQGVYMGPPLGAASRKEGTEMLLANLERSLA